MAIKRIKELRNVTKTQEQITSDSKGLDSKRMENWRKKAVSCNPHSTLLPNSWNLQIDTFKLSKPHAVTFFEWTN